MTNVLFQSCDEILLGLFIGNFASASNKTMLANKKIKLIVNCAIDLPNNYIRDFDYFNVPVYDNKVDDAVISEYLDDAVEKIRLHHFNKKNVFIHCFAGISRSSTVVAAYIMKYYKLSLDDTIKYIISKRQIAFHGGKNVVFRKALERFEKKQIKK